MEFYEKALLGGGCFWCVEGVFSRVEGFIQRSAAMPEGSARIQVMSRCVPE